MTNKSQALPIYASSKAEPYLKETIIINLMAVLLARGYMLESALPFGIALFGAAILNRYSPLPVFLSVTFGIITMGGLTSCYKYIAIMFVIYFIVRVVLRSKELKRYMVSLTTVFSVAGVSFAWLNLYGSYSLYDILGVAFEAFVGGILVYIFDMAIPVLADRGKSTGITREQAICASVVLALAITGLGSLRVWHLSIRTVVLAVAVLISGYLGGATAGSAMGALLGVASGLMGTRVALVVGVFSFAGLLAGVFRELGRLGSILGFIIGSAIMNMYLSGSDLPVIFMEELLAVSILFAVIPGKPLRYLSGVFSLRDGLTQNKASYSMKAKEMTTIRLKEFSKVFAQLADTFKDISLKDNFADNEGINRLLEEICNEVCSTCSFRKSCWEKEFIDSYRSLFDMIAEVEDRGYIGVERMPSEMKKKCIRPEALIETINSQFELFKINYKWQLKMEDCRNLVSQQLTGVAKVMENLAGEIDMELRFNEGIEQSIYDGLSRKGIRVQNIMAAEKQRKKLEIYIDKKACYGCRECSKKVIPVVEDITRRKFKKVDYMCSIKNDTCTIKLVEKQKFNVTTGVYTGPEAGSRVSGDNFSFMELNEQKYLIALSDGMGTGAQASMESATTINMLEQLLEVGYGHEMALKTINSIQMLKSLEDSFSTLDIVLVDLYDGEAKIVKVGAPPTYIKRRNGVSIINSSSLPVGIVDRVNFHTKRIMVSNDDYIVMVTDGIVDAYKREDGDDWIADSLEKVNNRNPHEIARILFEKAMAEYKGEARDDMTVLVSKVWRNA